MSIDDIMNDPDSKKQFSRNSKGRDFPTEGGAISESPFSRPPERVLVIGCPGAGKSTFARALRDATGLPLYYLDRIWHQPDRSTLSPEEFDRQLAQILALDRWIIDGNYLRTLEPRLRQCDTVFFLDYPLSLCLAGAEARIGMPREDLPWIEQEFDPEFRQWILGFPTQQLPKIQHLLERYQTGRHIFHFHSRADADRFWNAWPSRAQRPSR